MIWIMTEKENQKYRARLEETLGSVKSDGENFTVQENENVEISGENLYGIQTLVSRRKYRIYTGLRKGRRKLWIVRQ